MWGFPVCLYIFQGRQVANALFCSGENGILLPKLFWHTVRKNCSSDRKKLLKFEAEGREFAKILQSLEQFVQKFVWLFTPGFILLLSRTHSFHRSMNFQGKLYFHFGDLDFKACAFVQMVFWYQNSSDLLWEKKWNSRLKAENLQKFWDHLNNLFKQWKVRTISGNRMLF